MSLLKAKKVVQYEQLLKDGADVNEKNRYGNTPLHNCTSLKVMKLLMDAGANIDVKNSVGQTPLFKALKSNHKTMAKHLLENGAQLDEMSWSHMTMDLFETIEHREEMFYQLLKVNRLDLVEKLLEEMDPPDDVQDHVQSWEAWQLFGQGKIPGQVLKHAVETNQHIDEIMDQEYEMPDDLYKMLDTVEKLEPFINRVPENDYCLWLIDTDNVAVLEYYYEQKNPNLGRICRLYDTKKLIKKDYLEMVQFLSTRGVVINNDYHTMMSERMAKYFMGAERRPYLRNCILETKEFVDELVAAGAYISSETIGHVISRNKCELADYLLLKIGKDHYSYYNLWKSVRSEEMIKVLKKHCHKPELQTIAKNSCLAKYFYQKGASKRLQLDLFLNDSIKSGKTMLKYGADPSQSWSYGQKKVKDTWYGSWQIRDGDTVLTYHLKNRSQVKTNVLYAKWLLDNGAQVNAQDSDGKTAMDYCNNLLMMQLLQKYGGIRTQSIETTGEVKWKVYAELSTCMSSNASDLYGMTKSEYMMMLCQFRAWWIKKAQGSHNPEAMLPFLNQSSKQIMQMVNGLAKLPSRPYRTVMLYL